MQVPAGLDELLRQAQLLLQHIVEREHGWAICSQGCHPSFGSAVGPSPQPSPHPMGSPAPPPLGCGRMPSAGTAPSRSSSGLASLCAFLLSGR